MDWAGTIHLSWWELKEFMRHECRDVDSAVFRQINPDAESMDTILRRYTAQAVADLRTLTAAQLYEDVPDEFGFMRFAWPGDDLAAEESVADVVGEEERARSVGAEFRD